MRLHILKDPKIEKEHLEEVQRRFIDLYYGTTGIIPVFTHWDFSYTANPKEMAPDGDEHLTDKYLRDASQRVYNALGGAVDHVVLLIHRDNWNLTGIWGTNYSNIYNGYQLQVCRFDHRNLANSLGTLYHEVMHSHDALIKTYAGIDVNRLGLAPSWDKYIVHGGRPDAEGTTRWKYIRNDENTEALSYIAPYLKAAYEKRARLAKPSLLTLLPKLIAAYRTALYKKTTINK